MNPDDRRDALVREVAAVFVHARLAAVLIGGHAVNQWVRPRWTKDLDFTVAADPAALQRAAEGLSAAGFTVARAEGGRAASGPDFVRYVRAATGDIIELQTAKTAFQVSVIERALPSADRPGLMIATREDLIVLKRIANRSHDWADLVGLARIPGIDWAYVERWADAWQMQARLEVLRARLRRSGDLGEP